MSDRSSGQSSFQTVNGGISLFLLTFIIKDITISYISLKEYGILTYCKNSEFAFFLKI